MSQDPAKPALRIDGLALLVASFAAPATSLLLWVVWSLATTGAGAAGPGEQLLGVVVLLLLISTWGALPAGAFGGLVLWLVQRLRPEGLPLWAFILSGMTAAGLYCAVSLTLAQADQNWAFLLAPWTTDINGPGSFHPPTPIVTAIVLSGAVGALVYRRVSLRQAVTLRSSSDARRAEP